MLLLSPERPRHHLIVQMGIEPNPNRTIELCGLGSSRFLVSLLTVTKNSYLLNVNSFFTHLCGMHNYSTSFLFSQITIV